MTMTMSCWNFIYRSKLVSSTVCTNLTEAYGQPKAADGELGTPGLDQNDDTIASTIFSSLATWFFSKHGTFYVRFTWKCSVKLPVTLSQTPGEDSPHNLFMPSAEKWHRPQNGPIQGRRSTFLVYRPQESRRDCLGAVEGTHHGILCMTPSLRIRGIYSFSGMHMDGTRFSQTWKAKVTCMLHLLKMSLQNRLVWIVNFHFDSSSLVPQEWAKPSVVWWGCFPPKTNNACIWKTLT